MKKILVPTDFSEIAKSAEHYALALAKTAGAEIVLFHAGMDKGNTDLNALRAESAVASSSAQPVMARVVSDKKFGPESINEMIKEHGIDFIVMGTSGEEADMTKKIMGTNAASVLDGVQKPILLVQPGALFSSIDKIAYASDLWNIDKEIREVIEFAKLFNAAIRIFHVGPVFPDLGDVEKIDMKKKLEETKQKYSYQSITYSEEKTPMDNQVKKGMEMFLSHTQPDLLVMFHDKRSAFDKIFSSSNSVNLAEHLKKPLLVFPKPV